MKQERSWLVAEPVSQKVTVIIDITALTRYGNTLESKQTKCLWCHFSATNIINENNKKFK
jgi:hypothetical protein